MSCTIPSCQSLDSHITANPTSFTNFVVISGKLDLFPFQLRGGWGLVGLAEGWEGRGGFVCSLFLFSVIQLLNSPNANYVTHLSAVPGLL